MLEVIEEDEGRDDEEEGSAVDRADFVTRRDWIAGQRNVGTSVSS